MTINDNSKKQAVLIKYLKSYINDNSWKIKAEYSTNDNDSKVIIVQETTGSKVVFFGDIAPLYNYYMIDIYGLSVREAKELSIKIGNLIGNNVYLDIQNGNTNEKWQIIFRQFTNPQAIEYLDIRRVGYNATLQCIVNRIS